jgi:hypothetical protein
MMSAPRPGTMLDHLAGVSVFSDEDEEEGPDPEGT